MNYADLAKRAINRGYMYCNLTSYVRQLTRLSVRGGGGALPFLISLVASVDVNQHVTTTSYVDSPPPLKVGR